MADSSAEQCIAIIHDLERMLADARGSFRDQQTCVINREMFRNKLRVLSSSLPGAVRTATEYVSSINAIRQQTEQDCTTQRRDAEQRAEQLMSDARQNADHTRAEADQQLAQSRAEAQAIIDNARAEANRIIADAQQQAQQMLQRETILRRARVEASELRDTTQMEMNALRSRVFDYLDCAAADLDHHLAEVLTNLRRERGNLNGMR